MEALEVALVESQRRVTALETTNETLRARIAQLESGQSSMSRTMVDFKERLEWLEDKAKKKERVPID